MEGTVRNPSIIVERMPSMVFSLSLVQLPIEPPKEENATNPLINLVLFSLSLLFTLLAGLLWWGKTLAKENPSSLFYPISLVNIRDSNIFFPIYSV